MNRDPEAERPRLARLAAGLAHDLNNLLTAISGRLDLLLSELPADSPVRGDIEEMRRGTWAIARVVARLVEISGQAPVRPRPIAVCGLLESIERRVLDRRSGEVRVLTVREADAGPADVDPGQIRRVLEALVDNALDAIPGRGVLLLRASSVELPRAGGTKAARGAAADLPPGAYVRIEVTDNGRGMDDETLERVFEPYFSTKSGGVGRGLRLAAAREVVHQNGGAIRIDSEPGEGTSATVFLPAVPARETSAPA